MTARIILALVMLTIAGSYLSWRLQATGPGERCARRGRPGADDELASTMAWVTDLKPATIPVAETEHAPPWQPAPVPVIEPDAIMAAPVPEPEPEAYWIAAGTVSDGRVRLDHVAVLPPPVEAILGHRTVDEALESMFTRAMARQVRALTDGAP